jgi:hypothetical protein
LTTKPTSRCKVGPCAVGQSHAALEQERAAQDEITFLKPIAAADKAAKATKAIDDLTAKRKKRTDAINEQLREQRRTAMATGRDTGQMGMGRSGGRGGRGRTGGMSNTGSSGYTPAGPYGSPGARTPQRRGAGGRRESACARPGPEPGPGVAQRQARRQEILLEAVHQINLLDLDDLRLVAAEEQAKDRHGPQRPDADSRDASEDHEEMGGRRSPAASSRNAGPGGMPAGRGMQGTQQQMQPGMRGGRRGRWVGQEQARSGPRMLSASCGGFATMGGLQE